MGLFAKLASTAEGIKRGLAKTHDKLASGFSSIFAFARNIDDDTCEEIEELMISADMGVLATTEIIDDIREAHKRGEIENTDNLKDYLKDELKKTLGQSDPGIHVADAPPTVLLVAGVNGSGKTTSIAKLAKYFHDNDKKVLLAASDTFGIERLIGA